MKKILLSLFTLMLGLSAFAQTEYKFDDATAWGCDNPAQGEFTQIASGASIQNGNLKISVTFPEGKNGLRFFSHSTTGAINLRGYVESEVTISTVDGSVMTSFEISGTNLGATYITGEGYENGTWKGNANSVTLNIIKSTAQFNTIKVYAGGSAPADISNTPATAYTVTEALALIEKGEGLSSKVYVKGTISKVESIDTGEYGNATYFITDGKSELEVYRGYGLKGNKFTSEEDIQDGDEVIVYGKLVDYKGTKEFTTGSQIYSLNGKTDVDTPDEPEEPYTLVGNGTLENPYTTEDIIKGVYQEGDTITGVWVKGTILGCVNTTKGSTLSDKDPVASNIALGNADGSAIIPVQLIFVKDGDNRLRETVNVMDNPSNVGKTVYLYGDVIKYCGVAGLKNTSDYSWDGKTSSILAITSAAAKKIFNLNGQKLAAPQKGINIINGVKVLVK